MYIYVPGIYRKKYRREREKGGKRGGGRTVCIDRPGLLRRNCHSVIFVPSGNGTRGFYTTTLVVVVVVVVAGPARLARKEGGTGPGKSWLASL